VGTGDPDAALRRASAAAIAARPSAEGAAVARRLLADADAETRRWAILALEPGATRADLEQLAELSADPEPRVVIAALATAAAIVRSGRAGATDAWRARILGHLASPRNDVRLAAIAAADAFLRDPTLSTALGNRADQGPAWERHLAVRALALGGDDRAPALVMADRVAESPITRASAAEVAGILRLAGVVETLRQDSHPRVRAAAWRVTLAQLARQEGGQAEDRDRLLREVLSDPDLGVREAALDLLCAAPIAPIELLAPVLEAARGNRALPLRLAAARAIGCRGAAERLERGGAILALEKVFGDSDHPTRREVTAVLARLEEEAPAAIGSREISWGPERYREILDLGMVAARALRVSTDRGSFLIELECANVPLSCHFVRQLAGQGFYENTLVPSLELGRALVLGDPRGDGRGSAGFRVADEPDRRPIERGMVGLVAAAGPDTAGGPLFIALSPLPELAGKRAVIGRVVQGLDVVESLVPGDRIQRVELVTTKLSP
jgi:peptidyl-prolyl cis-trans isomerase B (cyclophilin B)